METGAKEVIQLGNQLEGLDLSQEFEQAEAGEVGSVAGPSLPPRTFILDQKEPMLLSVFLNSRQNIPDSEIAQFYELGARISGMQSISEASKIWLADYFKSARLVRMLREAKLSSLGERRAASTRSTTSEESGEELQEGDRGRFLTKGYERPRALRTRARRYIQPCLEFRVDRKSVV